MFVCILVISASFYYTQESSGVVHTLLDSGMYYFSNSGISIVHYEQTLLEIKQLLKTLKVT